MRRIKWLYGAIALGMFAACSSDDVPQNNGGNEPGKDFKGTGYMNVQVVLPSVNGTRANDVFDDGDEYEYEVDEAGMALFGKESGGKDYKFKKFVIIPSGAIVDGVANNNVTSIIEVTDINLEENEQLYALALINYDGVLTPSPTGESITVGSTTINQESTWTQFLACTSDMSEGNGKGYLYTKIASDKQENDMTKNEGRAKHFFMTNAILSPKAGGQVKPEFEENKGVFTLADVTGHFYDTEKEAMENPAGCIFVERAVAKVTVSLSENNSIEVEGSDPSFKLDGGDVTINAVVKKYALSNMEPKSYLVRHNPEGVIDGFAWNLRNKSATETKAYRMISGDQLKPTKPTEHKTGWYRTYFCADPNGNGFNEKANSALIRKTKDELEWYNVANPLYGFENTFSVSNQNNGNTTRVIFEVELTVANAADGSSKTFYMIKGDDNKAIYSENGVKNKKLEALTNMGYVPAIQDALKELLNTPAEGETVTRDINDLNFEWDTDMSLKSISIKSNLIGTIYKSDADLATQLGNSYSKIITAVNTVEVVTYKDGIAYYEVYVKHFGDDETPLPASGIKGTSTGVVYGGSAEDYLGRWGMVRNNWYEINVTKILNIGSADIPDIDFSISDDNEKTEKYIRAHIHILSWAKRTQDHVFK